MVRSKYYHIFNSNKTIIMKKVMFVFAVATMLVACGGNASVETTNTDSTAVADSSVVATDSTVAAIPADSTSAK